MKKYLLLLTTVVVLLSSCKKQEGYYINATATSTGSTTGTPTGGTGSTSTDTYQPVTAHSYWRYRNGTDTTYTIITGGTATFNTKVYYTANNSASVYTGVQTGYFYPGGNHFYSNRSNTLVNGITVDMVYLNDALTAGSTWTSKITDSGTINSVPAQTVGTIAEAGITRTVAGKVFKDVIHSKVDLQYDFGTGFQSFGIYEFYVAKNIGIIETSATVPGFVTVPSYLYDYSIK